MNRQEFLNELNRELIKQEIDEPEEIIEEFNEHFESKLSEGLTEERIIKKLESPKNIAKEYAEQNTKNEDKIKRNIIKGIALGCLSAFIGVIFVVLFCAVLIIAAFTLACLVFGFCSITTLNIGGIMPAVPAAAGVFAGLALLSLALVSAIGTIFCWLYAVQWVKAYVRWHNNLLFSRFVYPSVSAHPWVKKFTGNQLKFALMIGVFSFVVFCATAFLILFATGTI